MKASQVLKRYRAGERNFQHVNLRGQSFKSQNLAGAKFCHADIHGANFTEATLTGADFTGAKCGLTNFKLVHLFISCVIAGMFDLFLLIFFTPTILILSSNLDKHNLVIILLSILFSMLFYFIPNEIGGITAKNTALFILVGLFFIVAIKVNDQVLWAVLLLEIIGFLIAGSIAFAESLLVAVLAVDLKSGLLLTIISKIGGIIYLFHISKEFEKILFLEFRFSSLLATLLGIYLYWRAINKDEKLAWLLSRAIDFVSVGSTTFYKANLTDAHFNGAKLKSTDLRKAILTRVCWRDIRELDYVRFSQNTYLENRPLRQVLTTGKGQNKNFDQQFLRSINLQGANLTDASFIGTDLSEANLQEADLSKAKLVQTQLDGTDLTGATLTGACIEGWGITPDTILNGVRCDYIFMRLLPTERPQWLESSAEKNDDENRCRKPDDWQKNFEEGDFIDFITPLVQTLNLYHNKPVDPRLVAIAFQELKNANPNAELEIVSVEKKGKNRDKLDIKVDTAPQANLSLLHADYFTSLEHLEALPPEALKAIVLERGATLQMLLETRANIAINNSQTQGNNKMTDEQRNINTSGGNYTDQSRNFNNSGTINNSGAGAFNLGEINATVANNINQLPSSSNPNEPGIKDLLTQIQQAIDDPNLPEDDKKQTLEQLQVLAEAGQNPQNASMQKKAKKAVGFLQVIADGVEPATKLAKACAQVLPKIMVFFGF